jgi:hypothetical protein
MQKQLKTLERLKTLFVQKACWRMDDLCEALGYAAISVRRFLKQLGYFSSFTHNNKWYTLSSVPRFDRDGLWFWDEVGFSKHGTMKQTILFFINKSPQGLSAKDLGETLSVPCHAVLNHLYKSGKIDRAKSGNAFIYLSTDERKRRRQRVHLQRRMDRESKLHGLSAQAAVYVLAEFIKNPHASFAEISRAVAAKQVMVTPEAIARLFEKHDLKKTLH